MQNKESAVLRSAEAGRPGSTDGGLGESLVGDKDAKDPLDQEGKILKYVLQ